MPARASALAQLAQEPADEALEERHLQVEARGLAAAPGAVVRVQLPHHALQALLVQALPARVGALHARGEVRALRLRQLHQRVEADGQRARPVPLGSPPRLRVYAGDGVAGGDVQRVAELLAGLRRHRAAALVVEALVDRRELALHLRGHAHLEAAVEPLRGGAARHDARCFVPPHNVGVAANAPHWGSIDSLFNYLETAPFLAGPGLATIHSRPTFTHTHSHGPSSC